RPRSHTGRMDGASGSMRVRRVLRLLQVSRRTNPMAVCLSRCLVRLGLDARGDSTWSREPSRLEGPSRTPALDSLHLTRRPCREGPPLPKKSCGCPSKAAGYGLRGQSPLLDGSEYLVQIFTPCRRPRRRATPPPGPASWPLRRSASPPSATAAPASARSP